MKRFHFSLEAVLRHRQQRERLAKALLHQAQAVLAACQAEAQALERRLDDTAAALDARLGKALDAGAWLASYQHANHLGRALREAEARTVQAAQRVHQAAQQRRQTAIDVEVLERLRQRQRERHQDQADRAEQILLDQLSLRPWQQPDGQAAETEIS